MGRPLAALLFALVMGTACSPSPGPSMPPSPGPPSAVPAIPPSAEPASPTVEPTPMSSPYPAARLPVHEKGAGHGAFLRLAPAPDGTLYVLIPANDGAVLVRLDRSGAPAAGWPVTLPHTTWCAFLEAAADGSVRAICDATDIQQPDLCCNTVRAFALDAAGLPLPGWPVEIAIATTARVIDNDLVVLSDLPTTDIYEFGSVTSEAYLMQIGPDGVIAAGVRVPIVYRGGWEAWEIGPDGVAYATSTADGEGGEPNQVLAVDIEGAVDGWPVRLWAEGSPPAFADDGRLVLLVGGLPEGPEGPSPLHVSAIDPGNVSRVQLSPLPIELVLDMDCADYLLGRPVLSRGGLIVIRNGMSFNALDTSLRLLPGWPYEASSYRQEWAYPTTGDDDGLNCGVYADPVLGPDGTLFVPLSAESESKGGSLLAIDRGGNTVPGWPVTLRRAGSGFWVVAVAPTGTVFAAAVEKEKGGVSSTILGIAPDSTVLWRTTVLDQ